LILLSELILSPCLKFAYLFLSFSFPHWLLRNHALTTVPGCTNAQLVSALNSDDAGTLNAVNSLLELPRDQLYSVLGLDNMALNFTSGVQPVGSGSQWGNQECLDKCGLTREKFNLGPFFNDSNVQAVYDWGGPIATDTVHEASY
jgi:hypothetical protein